MESQRLDFLFPYPPKVCMSLSDSPPVEMERLSVELGLAVGLVGLSSRLFFKV
jgi:hypothetical protein